VNMILPKEVSCRFCESRKAMQDRHLKEIRRLYSDQFRLTELPLLDSEVRGIDQIVHLSTLLFEK
jgi:arsenite-transporting ATPase